MWMKRFLTLAPILAFYHPTLAVEVGDELCIQGFIMDYYCIRNVDMIDNGRRTLEEPDRHTVHCLVDVGICLDTAFEVLIESSGGSTAYSRGYRLDDSSKNDMINLARSVGSCSTCVNGYDDDMLETGFKAVMKVTVTNLNPNSGEGAPPLVRVNDRRDASNLGNDPCQSVYGMVEGVPLVSPTNPPTPPPTRSPTPPTPPPTTSPPTPPPTPPPTRSPTPPPTPGPTPQPTLPLPTPEPTPPPTRSPTAPPTAPPTPGPTPPPTPGPTTPPTPNPTPGPTPSPSLTPSLGPSPEPTPKPTLGPTTSYAPSLRPSDGPSDSPSMMPAVTPAPTIMLITATDPTLAPNGEDGISTARGDRADSAAVVVTQFRMWRSIVIAGMLCTFVMF